MQHCCTLQVSARYALPYHPACTLRAQRCSPHLVLQLLPHVVQQALLHRQAVAGGGGLRPVLRGLRVARRRRRRRESESMKMCGGTYGREGNILAGFVACVLTQWSSWSKRSITCYRIH